MCVSVINGDEVLRFGKGGVRGAREAGPRQRVPYPVPAWVSAKIETQRARLREDARLRGYDGR